MMTRHSDRNAIIRAHMAAHPGMTFTAAARAIDTRDAAASLSRLRQTLKGFKTRPSALTWRFARTGGASSGGPVVLVEQPSDHSSAMNWPLK